ncbi:MAG: glycosyltransferase family 2 protein [Lachnospiraceae bacterium]|nr:glycosyltransferase family 2 protein [Lachnospiraceae bacterium]
MKDKILLFIPAYNCEKQITRVLSQLDEKVLSNLEEVLVVDNRSTDRTREEVLSWLSQNKSDKISLVMNDENYGLGGSQKMAFQYAVDNGFDYVCMLHGDDQGDIHDFLPVFKSRLYKKHDCVLGARFMRGSRLQGYSLFRTFGNIVYDFIFAVVTRRRIYDLGSGLNLYSTRMLRDGFYKKFPDNLMFNYAMILASHYYQHDIVFYPVSWREDDQVSNVKMASQAVKVLKMAFEYFADNKSIRQEYRDIPRESYTCKRVEDEDIMV